MCRRACERDMRVCGCGCEAAAWGMCCGSEGECRVLSTGSRAPDAGSFSAPARWLLLGLLPVTASECPARGARPGWTGGGFQPLLPEVVAPEGRTAWGPGPCEHPVLRLVAPSASEEFQPVHYSLCPAGGEAWAVCRGMSRSSRPPWCRWATGWSCPSPARQGFIPVSRVWGPLLCAGGWESVRQSNGLFQACSPPGRGTRSTVNARP